MMENKTSDELSACREALADMEDRWKRALAELDNSRKRFDRELARYRYEERKAVLRDWLEVVDNLERALNHSETASADSLHEGVRVLHRQTLTLLSRYGVSRIPTVGELFDPIQHEAVGQTAGAPAGTIVEEVRPGYQITEDVLRPARVIVAKETAQEEVDGI